MRVEVLGDLEVVCGELRADHARMNIYKSSLAWYTFHEGDFTYWALVCWVAWYWSGV
jgi:hypothetical protein